MYVQEFFAQLRILSLVIVIIVLLNVFSAGSWPFICQTTYQKLGRTLKKALGYTVVVFWQNFVFG